MSTCVADASIAPAAVAIVVHLGWYLWAARQRGRIAELLRLRHPAEWERLGRPTGWRLGRWRFSLSADGGELDYLEDEELSRCLREYQLRLRASLETNVAVMVVGSMMVLLIVALVCGWVAARP